jgi:hypothetical protein
VRIVTSGRDLVVGEATGTEIWLDNQVAAAFKTGQAR